MRFEKGNLSSHLSEPHPLLKSQLSETFGDSKCQSQPCLPILSFIILMMRHWDNQDAVIWMQQVSNLTQSGIWVLKRGASSHLCTPSMTRHLTETLGECEFQYQY